ncbi:auxin efflux carrier [Cylindrobasidium torrendii FP15055 ss-10]|uniref:Auxin efflux carrier n=1 Tax=Cylindrobasidium torrendii FP15055 ss-10 TaxID=1314674 RepID=A0A0D7BW26_9AGAR|nr:auxin efflux carrier [Cylindrobasidium torrendii FP15055 ss-10]
MAFSAGFLIYSGIMPLLKMFLTIFFGFWVARKGLFPAAASRGASQITMNIALPALIFSNIVPAFNNDNIPAIGPLFLVAFFYMGLGGIFGIIIREVCYVPRNFWQGIVIATALSNWGNLPTAIVMTVTQSKPFNPSVDTALGISFVSIFIFSYNIVMWILGGAASLAWDFAPGVPQGEAALQRVSWREKPIARLFLKWRGGQAQKGAAEDCEKACDLKEESGAFSDVIDGELEKDPEIQLARRASHLSSTASRRPSVGISGRPTVLPNSKVADIPSPTTTDIVPQSRLDLALGPVGFKIVQILLSFFSPVTTSMYISIVCALVPTLKALFVKSDAGPSFIAPDGNPPLNFVTETAKFVGNITVPMALILLGASFARMQIPKPLNKLPIPAILSVTFAKLVLLPVIGILFCQGIVTGGIVPKDALVERFVGMLLSGTPSAVNQLVVTQLYTTQQADIDTLCAFLLAQYVFMFISTAAITAISLALL